MSISQTKPPVWYAFTSEQDLVDSPVIRVPDYNNI